MSYLLGIDVGTTRTAAAISQLSGGRPGETEIVNLGDRSTDVPSVLFVAPDGAVVVGEAAERRALTDPDRVVREFKRRIGDPTPVVVAGRAWAPEELSARLVRWVVDRVAEREGGPAARIAVTHPASWGAHKKELLAAALAGQGLAVTFLAEPQAAALHYAAAERVEPGSTIAVYDLGGGTFDAAVVRKDAGFGLLGRPEGLERLGGVDFDEVVFDHVRDGLPEAFEGLDEADAAVLAGVARVRRECTEAKEALSADTEVSVPVLLPGSRGAVRLHRSEFEQMIRPQVEETVAALRRAVASAGLTPEGLSAVLLVGGSSRIPLVAQLVSEQLGRPVAVDADPKNAIAKGAVLALAPQQTAAPAAGGRPSGPSGPDGFRPTAAAVAPPPPPPKSGLGAAAAGAGAGFLAAAAMGPDTRVAPYRGPDSPTTDQLPAVMARDGDAGAGHDPAPTRYVTDRHDAPPMRFAREDDPGFDDEPYYDDEPYERPHRKMPVWMVGVGGAVAAVGVIAAVLLWPQEPATSATTQIQPAAPVPTPTAPEAVPSTGGAAREGVTEPRATHVPRASEPAPAPTTAAKPPEPAPATTQAAAPTTKPTAPPTTTPPTTLLPPPTGAPPTKPLAAGHRSHNGPKTGPLPAA
ncbi:Hsp70 family protein [Pseudonocardia acidicola]|uniref:Hsp70 family protein n=1 Tax=Pseudonocardia acidicola TaxID=2724939 RepID=A0ABX1SJR0_9PSEU|nr:Hsp70 family protein [Pseudonocardia acidicola]NMI01088.1 Hsp70 family protein [Pseudonocardia acidicola]